LVSVVLCLACLCCKELPSVVVGYEQGKSTRLTSCRSSPAECDACF